MSQETGEDQRHLHRILDLFRIASIVTLFLHYVNVICPPCQEWVNATPILDRLMSGLVATGLFDPPVHTKILTLLLLAPSLIAARGRKETEYRPATGLYYLFGGLALFFTSGWWIAYALPYFLYCSIGYGLIFHGGTYLSRVVWIRQPRDIFNRLHESFPHEERLLQNKYSVNLSGEYASSGRPRTCWINIVDPFRGTLILGSPGSGKTWYLIEPLIKQYIGKGYALLVYDFKYDDLTRIVYNHFIENKARYPGTAAHYNLHFGDPDRSHRANPIHPRTLKSIQDAGEAARSVIIGMTKEGMNRHGEFFIESAVIFVQALVWYLRVYQDGIYCTWPHVIELAQVPYDRLFAVLKAQSHLQALLTPFMNALENAPEQLEGQIATATIGLAKLSSPEVYYIMSGDDFSLELNDPAAPKLLTIGSDPQKTDTYGPMISAYVNTINRLANCKDRYPLAEIFDEFSTVRVHTILRSITTGRSNKMAITLCTQDASLLHLGYGKEFSDAILNTCGNIISGQTAGETAKLLSDRFGKTMQDRESFTTSDTDLQISQGGALEYAIPVSRIASLSSGEFVGMVADTPSQPIELKTFCCRLTNHPAALAKETAGYKDLPPVRTITPQTLDDNFQRIRTEITILIRTELGRLSNRPA